MHPPEPVSGPAMAQSTRTGFSGDSSSRLSLVFLILTIQD